MRVYLELISKPDEQCLFVSGVDVFAYTNSTFSEHDVEKLHGSMLNGVGSEHTHSPRFVILVEENFFQVTKSPFVVLGLEALS